MHTTKDVPITSISSTFQIRESTDEKHVQEIVRSIQEDGWKPGEYLDVIQPDPEQEKFKLADGNHRLQALKLLGWTEAPIRIIGSTDLDLYKQAYKVNAGHGVRLTRAEKEHFLKEMLKLYCGVLHKWPLARFIKEFEISRPTAEKYKSQLEEIGFEFPETAIGIDGREMPTKQTPKSKVKILYPDEQKPDSKAGYKILYPDEQKPDSKAGFKILNPCSPTSTGQTFCENGCGTPIWDEMKGNPDCQYVQREGHWFCSEDCAEEWNQNRLSDEAERLTGISDKLPANPSARVATKQNPINYPTYPAEPVKTQNNGVSSNVLEDFTDADEPENVLRLEISKNDDETTIAGKISQIFDFVAPPYNINNIINILINNFNLNLNLNLNIIGVSDKKSGTKKSKKDEPLSEEQKTGFIWKLNDGSDWELPKSELETFRSLYPAVDVEQALRTSIGWNLSEPTRRKTKKGILKHINTWLANQQNRGGGKSSGYNNGNQYPQGRKRGYVSRDAGLDFEHVEY